MEKVIDRVMRTYGMSDVNLETPEASSSLQGQRLTEFLKGKDDSARQLSDRRSEISPWRSTFAHTACPALTAPSGLGGAAQYARLQSRTASSSCAGSEGFL